jgi:hypothetical protein
MNKYRTRVIIRNKYRSRVIISKSRTRVNGGWVGLGGISISLYLFLYVV